MRGKGFFSENAFFFLSKFEHRSNARQVISLALPKQAIMLAVIKKLTYNDEYNFENEVSLQSRLVSRMIRQNHGNALEYFSFSARASLCSCLSLSLSPSYPSLSPDLLQGEDEAMFVEYRKQLKMLLDRLAQVSPELLLQAVRRVFSNTML